MPEVTRKLHCVKEYVQQTLPGASNPTTVQSIGIIDSCVQGAAMIISWGI